VVSAPCQLVLQCLTASGLVKPALEDVLAWPLRRLCGQKPAGIFAPGVRWFPLTLPTILLLPLLLLLLGPADPARGASQILIEIKI
jgi:hypothetical protein